MNFVNIGDLDGNINDIILAKIAVENELIELGEIEKPLSIGAFFQKFSLLESIFSIRNKNEDDDLPIPFLIYKTKKNSFVFFSMDINENTENNIKTFKTALANINYDLGNLRKVDLFKMYESGKYLPDSNYFLLKQQLYIV